MIELPFKITVTSHTHSLVLPTRRRSYPARSDISEGSNGRPIRFAVRSLGWVEIAEEDLTPERSSKAVNRCIVDLSVGRRDVLDVVGCWGDVSPTFSIVSCQDNGHRML